MTETARHELDEAAPAAFVNGDATHQHKPARGPQRVPKGAPRRNLPPREPDESTANLALMAWPDGVEAALRLHEAWRDGIGMLAREQLAYLADAGSELVATGQALAAEPDPARRIELAWSQTVRQLERSLEASARLIEILSSSGLGMLDPGATGRRRPG